MAEEIKRGLLFWITVLEVVIAVLVAGVIVYWLGARA